MKLAIVQGFKAFFSQVRENVLEVAKTTCERNGYSVQPKTEEPKKNENSK